MKKHTVILVIFVCTLYHGNSQNSTPSTQTNYSLNFNNFLAGVKYAAIFIAPQQEEYIRNYPITGTPYFALKERLSDMGFEYVDLWASEWKSLDAISSECDRTVVFLTWEYTNNSYTKIQWTFTSCNGDSFTFNAPQNISGTATDVQSKFYNASIKMYGYNKPTYSKSYRYSLKGEKTNWTESSLKEHFKTNGVDQLEGIYENATKSKTSAKYKVGVIKATNGYKIIYLSGATNFEDWVAGDVKAKLTPTATSLLFKTEWYMANKASNSDLYISFEQGSMNVIWPDETLLYIKLYPTAADNLSTTNNAPSSGSGFAISSSGLIATNSHVISGASSIKVRGINGDFSKTYNAKLITEDKNNDLAIISIDDKNFTSIGSIPYLISNNNVDVGTSIFVLGYPLRATMGDEIKLTNGIISSKTGFQGDVTSYQLSAPVQPGNSGGPLFDDKGNIVGVINAKHLDTENVTYAVKSTYLLNLIEILPLPPKLQPINNLGGKTLSEQVKLVKNYTYIIEVN